MAARPSARTRCHVAELAAEDAHSRATGGRRQANRRDDAALLRPGWSGKTPALCADPKMQLIVGKRVRDQGRSLLLAMGFVHLHEGPLRGSHRSRPARQCRRRSAATTRSRRFAAGDMRRPVAGGVGDPRRPPVRPPCRQIPDKYDHPAVVIVVPRLRGRPPSLIHGLLTATQRGCLNRRLRRTAPIFLFLINESQLGL